MGVDVKLVSHDDDPDQPSDPALALDDPPATHEDDATPREDPPVAIKAEDDTPPENADDGGVMQRPAKRRRVEDLTPRRSASRAVSPPWKSFSADGPTTIITDGVRKSTRFSKDAATPAPEPSKRSTRHATKALQPNGNTRSLRQSTSRATSGSVASSKGKATSTLSKKASAASLKSPPSRKSERQRINTTTTTAGPSSPEVQHASPIVVKRRPGRPRKTALPASDAAEDPFTSPTNYYSGGYDHAGPYSSPSDANANGNAPRLRLRFRRPDPPNRHPQHAPPPSKYPTFTDWLQNDDALEGEEAQKITIEKAREEAERRMQIVEAAETGVLSRAQCSIFVPQAAEEPPSQYRHWDHVVAHALHFNKLLRDEKAYHRRIAKTLAKEAVEYWKEKYKRKTQEEIDQEEAERTVLRYRQLVKDVKDSWANVKAEIDKERVAKWEEEQLQLGHKAMDDMFNQAQEILGRGGMVDSASSFFSDDRETEDDDELGTAASGASDDEREEVSEDDDNMSSSGESDDGDGADEDANLTAEQLQAKYGQLPDLPQASSEVDEDSETDQDDDMDDRTPEPTPDQDLVMEDAESPKSYTHTNGFHDDEDNEESERKTNGIDAAAIKLFEEEKIDEALLDTEDEGGKSESGSEAWSSDEDSEEEEEQSESGSEEEEGGFGGVMGFLAPNDIKKMKEAAKTAIEDKDEEEEAPKTNGVNGHASPEAEDNLVEMKDDAEVKGAPEVEEMDKKKEESSAKATPTIEVQESETLDDAPADKTISRSRSRHDSSPPRTEIPSLLRGTLREYQHDGLDWLANLHDTDTNGILADEMGLGKTIQTISLLAYAAVHRGIWGPHLIVVPTSVMLNWEMEFKKWCPGFKILTYYGDINERKRKRTGWRTTGPDMYNVIITSYQLILQDAAAFKMRAWRYLILDEAHNIKNFKSQRWQTMLNLRTERRLLLTGTPLQNNIDELWSLLYFLMPAGFAGEGRIAGLEEFTMALKNPTSQILEQGRQQLDAEAQKIVKKLHEVLRPYLLRRLKADVEKQMPAKYEHVVYCKLSKRQRQLYDGFMGRASTKETLASGNYLSIINCLMSLRKVCNHPDLFETRAIVTSMAMPKSVAAAYEIKAFFVQKRLFENKDTERVSLDALNLVFKRREEQTAINAEQSRKIRAIRPLEHLIERQTRRLNKEGAHGHATLQSTLSAMADRENVAVRDHLETCLRLTRARTQFMPIYGKGLIDQLTLDYNDYAFGGHEQPELDDEGEGIRVRKGRLGFRKARSPILEGDRFLRQISHFLDMVPTLEDRAIALEPTIMRFSCVTPAVAAEEIAPLSLSKRGVKMIRSSPTALARDVYHESRMHLSIAFPDKRLLQYDCGKLQRLAVLLRDLQAGGHRALIFTQMTKVLDILEQFLNIHGHRYLRLDGATKIEQRQILTDRFNTDPRILCFILSSRSGGLGINLTGADTVIFYDLDWNPAMDKQCQDRSHRIGQTRDVHIYKFVSEYTIEANILRKSNQKRLLDDVIIQKGDFTTDYFNKMTWRDALDSGDHEPVDEAGAAMNRVLGEKVGLLGDAKVMRGVEDTEDQNAANMAQKEIVDELHDDQVDFNESTSATPANAATRQASEAADAKRNSDAEKRHVDEYMLDLYREEFGKEPYRPPTDRQKRQRKGQDVHRTQRRKKY